jgi:hypothetical protein
MWLLPPSTHFDIPVSIWSFLRDVGPLLAICTGGSLVVALAILVTAELLMRKRRMRRWLAQNRSTLRKVLILGYFARSLGRQLPPCGNCGGAEYHLWNYAGEVVVYRCSRCKYSYSLSAFAYPQIRFLLRYLPALLVLLHWMKTHAGDPLFHHLWKLCAPVEAFCRRRLASGGSKIAE